MKTVYVVTSVALVASVVMLGGCATIVARPAHSFEVISDVEARCEVSDKAGSRTVTVPGPVPADPRHGPAQLACSRDGYKPYHTTVAPEFNAAVVGNFIFGGIVGAAVDVGTGNHKRYPGQVFLVMEPEHFESGAARDAWLAYREQTLAALREEHAPEPVNPKQEDPSLR